MEKQQQLNLPELQIEDEEFLTTQIITYIGNKRSLLDFIGKAVNIVKKRMSKDKLEILDIFSGSGIVSRYLKQHSSKLITNDLEEYSYILNSCYLSNKKDLDMTKIVTWFNYLNEEIGKGFNPGFISEMYAPKDLNAINKGERCFYTPYNAKYIDTCRKLIEKVPEDIRKFYIAPLLTEASIKNNTSGVFKGFYKNSETGLGQFGGNNRDALSRITREISLPFPVFSNFDCEVKIYCKDANKLVDEIEEVDLVYMDPPYNQHPYGSNYFMLNLIKSYKKPKEISEVSGIPKNWNRSSYNKPKEAYNQLLDLCKKIKAKFLLISFNSDGFIKKAEMLELLSRVGRVEVMETKYNTFRGSRNLRERNIHVSEYLYLVEKYKKGDGKDESQDATKQSKN